MNLYDLIILAVLAFFIYSGVRRGMVLTVCGIVLSLAALFGAQIAADTLSPAVAGMLRPAIEDTIQLRLEEAVGESVALPEEDAVTDDSTLPAGETEQTASDLIVLLSGEGLLGQMLQSDVYQHFSQSVSQSVQTGVETAAGAVAASLAQSAAWLAVYLIAFFLILVVGRLAAGVLDLAARLPVLRFLNRSLGGVCGLLKGVVVLVVICSVAVSTGLIAQESVRTSALLGLFSSFRPLGA